MTRRPTWLMGSFPEEVSTAREAVAIAVQHTVAIPGQRPIYAMAEAPDVGGDPHWMAKLLEMVSKYSEVKVIKRGKYPQKKRYVDSWVMRLKKGQHLNPETLNLQLFDRGKQAYDAFLGMQKQGIIPADAMMLVDVYVIDFLLLALPLDAKAEMPTVLAQAEKELHALWEYTGHNIALLITAPTTTVVTNATRNAHRFQDWRVDAYVQLINSLPTDALYVFHPCYARAGNSALFRRTRRLVYKPIRNVRLWNAIAEKVQHRLPLAICLPMAFSGQGPVLRRRYYRAYKKLKFLSEIFIFAGAAYYDLTDRQKRRLVKLFNYLDKLLGMCVGVCYTCGLGSLTRKQMGDVLACQDMVSNQT